MLEAPADPRIITADAGGAEVVYNGVCAGCHAYNVRLIGPPALVIQAQYGDDAQAIADYVAEPVRRRPDFPNMPPQGHVSEEMRLLVAEYMLGLDG